MRSWNDEGHIGGRAEEGGWGESLICYRLFCLPLVEGSSHVSIFLYLGGVTVFPLFPMSHAPTTPTARQQLVTCYQSKAQPIITHFFSLVVTDPVSADVDQYDPVSLTDTLRGFLQDLLTPIIPTSLYSELVYTAQGKVLNPAQPAAQALGRSTAMAPYPAARVGRLRQCRNKWLSVFNFCLFVGDVCICIVQWSSIQYIFLIIIITWSHTATE